LAAEFLARFELLRSERRPTAEADAILKTGLPWFDTKHWYEHTPSEIGVLQEGLTQSAKDMIHANQVYVDFAKVCAGTVGAFFGGPLAAFFGGMIGTVGFNELGRQQISDIQDWDKAFCKGMDYDYAGCEEYIPREKGKEQGGHTSH
jgi:hypothetical protein